MEPGRSKIYYKALRKAAALLNSPGRLKTLLEDEIRLTAHVLQCGVSLLLTDVSGDNLIHTASWGLNKSFIKKGVVSSHKSLAEIISGQPVVIADVAHDARIQYPKSTLQAGIVSILGVPLFVQGKVAGTIRVYSSTPTAFDPSIIGFVTAMADIVAVTLFRVQPPGSATSTGLLSDQAGSVTNKNPGSVSTPAPALPATFDELGKNAPFVHPSENEFAGILNFYHIEWLYEPTAFPLHWEGDSITEMFTPDFYLPTLDLYVELTTLKQSLVTAKNRKIRRLRELHPEIKITLLYRRDIERLLAKYGFGPLAEKRGQGVQKVLFSTLQINQKIHDLADQIALDYNGQKPILIGVLRGVFCFMADLVRQINLPLEVEFMAISYYGGIDKPAVKITKDIDISITGRPVILVEDIVDTGMTLNYMLDYLKMRKPASLSVCALLDKRARRLIDVPLKYVGFEIGDEFVVGYGLDYREEYRNLPYIGILETEINPDLEYPFDKSADNKNPPK